MVSVARRLWRSMGSGDGLILFGRWPRGWLVLHRPRLSAQLMKFPDGQLVLDLAGLWLYLWFSKRAVPGGAMMQKWGFYRHACGLWLCWSTRSKAAYFPWALEFVRREYLREDGTWGVKEEARRLPRWLRWLLGDRPTHEQSLQAALDTIRDRDDAYRVRIPYRYVTRGGQTQITVATVSCERITWCRRLFWKLGMWWPKKSSTDAWASFDDEIGEEVGTFKGGVCGAGVVMRPGESPTDAVRRMESERRFD